MTFLMASKPILARVSKMAAVTNKPLNHKVTELDKESFFLTQANQMYFLRQVESLPTKFQDPGSFRFVAPSSLRQNSLHLARRESYRRFE